MSADSSCEIKSAKVSSTTSDVDDLAIALRLSLELNREFQCELDSHIDGDYALALSEELNPARPAPPHLSDADYALALSLTADHSSAVDTKGDDDTAIARLMQHNEDDQRSIESLPIPFYVVDGSFKDGNAVTIEGVLHREQECGSSHGNHTNLCFYMSFCAGDGKDAVTLKTRSAPAANAICGRLRPSSSVRFDGTSIMADTEVFMAVVKLTHTPICVANRDAGRIVIYVDGAATLPSVKLHLRGGHFTLLRPV